VPLRRIRTEQKVLVEVSYPLWFRVFYGVCAIVTVVIAAIVAEHYLVVRGRVGESVCALVIGAIALCGVPLVFRSLIATEDGLELDVIGRKPVRMAWADIHAVKRPTLRIPKDAAYIVSRTGQRLLIVRSMSGVAQLISLVEAKARNLERGAMSGGVVPKTSWRPFLITLAILAAYIVFRIVVK
jgi:hypothetical protein